MMPNGLRWKAAGKDTAKSGKWAPKKINLKDASLEINVRNSHFGRGVLDIALFNFCKW
jgi:chitinase